MTPAPESSISSFKSKSGLQRILSAAGYSAQGLLAAYRYEHAFRQELWLGVPLIVVAWLLELGAIERVLLIASVLLVFVVELLNSAIEAVVDLVSPEFHLLAKRAKDIGSAAVLVALLNVLVIWLIVLAAR